jgi:hypothetical protein
MTDANIVESFQIEEPDMKKIGENDWLLKGSVWDEEEVRRNASGKMPVKAPVKTVMVYWTDKKQMRKEPIGILMERRATKRENDEIGMLRLARKTFARTEEEAQRIIIGDYV